MLLKLQQQLQRQREVIAYRMKKLAAKQVEITVSLLPSVVLGAGNNVFAGICHLLINLSKILTLLSVVPLKIQGQY